MHPRRLRIFLAGAALTAWSALAVPVRAQSLGLSPDRQLPSWLTRWSVLAPRADLPRWMPSASTVVPLSLLARTPIGLFWTAGNPAGLTGSVDSARTDIMAAVARTRGDFRRPLEPSGTNLTRVSAISWRPFDHRLTMLGSVVLDQERLDQGSQSDETEPYPTSPFVTTDTSTSPIRRIRARLEGVAGWALGDWALGIAAGYDSRENQTIAGGLVRRIRQTMPGVALGATRRVAGIKAGITARYRDRSETILLTERAAEGVVMQLEGYQDVAPLGVNLAHYRRIEEGVASASLGLEGRLGTGRWVLFGEAARLRERRTRQQQDDPAFDRWNAASWTAGGAYQRFLGSGGRWVFTLDARYTSLTGDGDLATDSAGTVFIATERAFDGLAELRLLPVTGGWTGLIALSIGYERRVRNDSVAVIGSDVKTFDPGVSLEIGRALSSAVTLIGTGALLSRASNSAIPAPLLRGQVYQRLIAPELGLYTRDVTASSAGAALRWDVSTHTGLWLSVRTESVKPRGFPTPTAFGPTGSRTASSVILGVVMR